MNEEILNTVYSASLEFGENFHKPIIDIVAELYPSACRGRRLPRVRGNRYLRKRYLRPGLTLSVPVF